MPKKKEQLNKNNKSQKVVLAKLESTTKKINEYKDKKNKMNKEINVMSRKSGKTQTSKNEKKLNQLIMKRIH